MIFVVCSISTIAFGQVDYNSDIQSIFNSNCIDCHGNSAGLNLSSYSNLISGSDNMDVIVPYDHAVSELWILINSGEMPDNNPDLDPNEVDLIAQWIDEGALENPGSAEGCIDPQAYNCADDVWIDGEDYPYYTFLIGTTPYINGCNYGMDPYNANVVIELAGCEDGPCEGYYNPGDY